MISNNTIVEATSGDVKSIIDNMAVKEEHRDDLFQEVELILLTYPNEKLESIYTKGQLKFFASRILCNQYYSIHSAFYKNYKKYEDNKHKLAEVMGKNERFD